LALAIIDEQHKFGVNQRLRLVNKTAGCHCLLMTATPIPRSLSLTQYGDLDISIIKTLPGHRRGFKTRIISPETYPKFLSFLKTRLSLGEQAYLVVPAIEESEGVDIANLLDILKKYKNYFPQLCVEGLHGQLKSNEKQDILDRFNLGKIHSSFRPVLLKLVLTLKMPPSWPF
jgi:ATP-dependent DNA helicase RecG